MLKPALRLASRFLTTDCLLDFPFAIFYGEERRVYDKVNGRYSHDASFRPRAALSHANRAAVKQRWLDLANMVAFRVDVLLDGLCGFCESDPNRPGVAELAGPGSKITIAEADLQVLFSRINTTTAEDTLLAQWELAVSLVHELMHAAMYAAWDEDSDLPFEYSTAAETGFEWEHFVFGGTIWKNEVYLDPRRQRCVRPWPAATIIRRYQSNDTNVRVIGEVPTIEFRWMPRLGFFDDLFSSCFWEQTVPRQGAVALRAYGHGEKGIRARVDGHGLSEVFRPDPSHDDYKLGAPNGYEVEGSGRLVTVDRNDES